LNVTKKLQQVDSPFGTEYQSYIVAALISFDMGRMMGQGLEQKYDPSKNGFAAYLDIKMRKIQPYIEPLVTTDISIFEHDLHYENIVKGYNVLAYKDSESLNLKGGEFHVGATKILHFINPNLFPIIDSNAAKTLNELYNLKYRKTTQPGYCGALYIQSMATIRKIIWNYGIEKFRDLEPGTPIMRIFDKLTFAYGNHW